MSDVGFVLEVDTAPLLAMAHRAGTALETIGREVAAILRRGNAAQFAAGALFEGSSVVAWPAPKSFGTEPDHPAMRLTGTLESAWTSDAHGGYSETAPRAVFVGIKGGRQDAHYAGVFHRKRVAKVKPGAGMRFKVGGEYGVWFSAAVMASGFEIAPRPLGVSDTSAQEVAGLAEVAIAGADGEVVV